MCHCLQLNLRFLFRFFSIHVIFVSITEEVKRMMEFWPTTLQEKCFLRCFGEGTETVRAIK